MVSGGELARATGRPVLIGPSRKRFLRRVLPESATAQDVDSATVGAALAAVRGGAQLLRIHAVALLRPALAVYIRK
jgi:dihydropteroate synthase